MDNIFVKLSSFLNTPHSNNNLFKKFRKNKLSINYIYSIKLREVKKELDYAQNNFNEVIDDDLLELYIHKLNDTESKLNSLIKDAKKHCISN